MSNVFFDPIFGEPERRLRIYAGEIMLLSPTRSSLELCAFARELAEEAFRPYDPRLAHRDMPVEKYVEILSALKPRFIHHPRSKELLCGILSEIGCDLETTYFDVPRLRTAPPSDYLNSGISYAFHPHRDTWYSAPMSQINFWFPMHELEPGNAMAFHPRYFTEGLKNSSRNYNYQEWNKASRQEASKHIKIDTRVQPKPEEEVEINPQIRLLPPVGGVILFSGAQLHSTVPNQTGITRFSIDFRIVNVEDVRRFGGAVNVDSDCTGTSLRDFLRPRDFEPIPEALAKLYDGVIPQGKKKP